MLLKPRRTGFIHRYAPASGIVCPAFYVLGWANGCRFGCHYCYLKYTLRFGTQAIVYSNRDRLLEDVRRWLVLTEEPSVLNAGELSDSFAWDPEVSPWRKVVPLFAGQDKHVLLLVTKSNRMSPLDGLQPTNRVVCSITINADTVVSHYEEGTVPALNRILALWELAARGWRARARIDPVVPFDGWQNEYADLIDKIKDVPVETVTLGTLRFHPAWINHSTTGHDLYRMCTDVGYPDGKRRLPHKQRREIYEFFIERLPGRRIGVCKETAFMHSELRISNYGCNCSHD